jgi:hypothetical protein
MPGFSGQRERCTQHVSHTVQTGILVVDLSENPDVRLKGQPRAVQDETRITRILASLGGCRNQGEQAASDIDTYDRAALVAGKEASLAL